VFAALPNVFLNLILTIFKNNSDVIFEVEIQYMRAKTIKK
jgi:hypothetical protein